MKRDRIQRWNKLLECSTVELIRTIVEQSDKTALEVLLETRRLFYLQKERHALLLPEYLMKMREKMASMSESETNDYRLADCAYDLTISKYSNFPISSDEMSKSGKQPRKGTRVDCRKYYGAFLRKFEETKKKGEIKSPSQEEFEAGRLLQNMVFRNFLRSRLDCSRITPFSKRYEWVIEGKKIYLWYPSYLTPKEFKAWLEENVKNLNPKPPNAKKRIQSLIDESLGRGYHIPFEDLGIAETLNTDAATPLITTQEEQMFGWNLADAVAQEKAENPNVLRPAIRKLGEQSIKQLILQIFAEIEHDDYDITRIASQYGLSKASLSRFAGSTWYEKMETDQPVTIPDLWKNTAQVLAGNPTFMQTVIDSKLADRFAEVLAAIKTQRGKRDDG
jgi:hypothetical protein